MTINPPSQRFRHISTNPYAPEKNIRHHTAARHALELYRKKAIYSFIPKNACSTMRYSLGIENGFIQGPRHFRWIHDNTFTFSADLRALITAEYSFVILRCPFARVASAYLDKIVGNQVDIWNLLPIYATSEKAETVSFRRFVEILSNRGILRSNHHWQPQVDFLVYTHYSDYFALEDFEKAVNTLKRKIDFKVHDARELYGHDRHSLTSIDGRYSDTPAFEIADLRRKGQIPSIQSLYDSEIYEQVKTIFAEDIDLYTDKTGREVTVSI